MMLDEPKVGMHYPGGLSVMRTWSPGDAACRANLGCLRWLQASGQRDRGHDLSWHPHPVDGVVRGRMADDDLEVGHQRAELAPGTRSGQLPDVVGDAAPLPRCDGRASARQTLWRSGDGRNVHRRGQARQTWPG